MRDKKRLTKEDLIELDYSFSYLKTNKKKGLYRSNTKIILNAFTIFFKQLTKDILSIPKRQGFKNKTVFLYDSTNQRNSLLPLCSDKPDVVFVNFKKYSATRLPQTVGILFSFLYMPRFFSIVKKSGDEANLLRSGSYHLIEGMYVWWRIYLKMKKPKAILFSNDHLIWHRVLKKAAEYNNIPTIYVQHASVTEKFPALDFDLSLLEGQDAYDKYERIGMNGKIELIGMPKYDQYYPYINKNNKVKTIGICTNLIDDELLIKNFCKEIREHFRDEEIYIRPHPRDLRNKLYINLSEEFNFKLSDSNKENSFEFMKRIDVNIAGESSVHLEAVLMNVYTVHYKFNNVSWDHYGYLKNKLVVESFDNIQDLTEFIKTIKDGKPNVRNRAKYYIATIDTQFDGKSSEKAMKIIDEFNKNK